MLPNDKKAMIAGELDRSVREIERKISVCCRLEFLPLEKEKETLANILLCRICAQG